MIRVVGLWVVGLVTIVPLSVYRLLANARFRRRPTGAR
jgi:hypothetical protein